LIIQTGPSNVVSSSSPESNFLLGTTGHYAAMQTECQLGTPKYDLCLAHAAMQPECQLGNPEPNPNPTSAWHTPPRTESNPIQPNRILASPSRHAYC